MRNGCGYDDFCFLGWFELGGFHAKEIEEQMQIFAEEVMPALTRLAPLSPFTASIAAASHSPWRAYATVSAPVFSRAHPSQPKQITASRRLFLRPCAGTRRESMFPEPSSGFGARWSPTTPSSTRLP
jgi:hypothetical protein